MRPGHSQPIRWLAGLGQDPQYLYSAGEEMLVQITGMQEAAVLLPQVFSTLHQAGQLQSRLPATRLGAIVKAPSYQDQLHQSADSSPFTTLPSLEFFGFGVLMDDR